LLDAGTIKTIVMQTFALSQVAQLEEHDQHARGKTVFDEERNLSS